MSKKQDTEENPFAGFDILKGNVTPEAVKAVEPEIGDSDELSAVELEALAKAEAKIKETAKEKAPAKEEASETETAPKAEEADETPADEPEEGLFKTIVSEMISKGILDVEDVDSIEDSEEGLEQSIKLTVDKAIQSYKQALPEDGVKFLEFVENGGNPADFHKYYYGEASFEDFDISDEENQKHVIKEALKLEEYTEEEIEEEISDLEDLGKLQKKAEVFLKKLQKVEKEQKNALLEAQKAYATQQEESRLAEWKKFEKGLMEKETIGGFKFSPKMKQDVWDYMAKPVNKKTGETQYQKDIKENEDARYMFAYLLKNKWNIKNLEQQVQSKEVSKLKSKLSNYTDSRAKMKSTPNKIEKQDDGSNPFAGFKSLT